MRSLWLHPPQNDFRTYSSPSTNAGIQILRERKSRVWSACVFDLLYSWVWGKGDLGNKRGVMVPLTIRGDRMCPPQLPELKGEFQGKPLTRMRTEAVASATPRVLVSWADRHALSFQGLSFGGIGQSWLNCAASPVGIRKRLSVLLMSLLGQDLSSFNASIFSTETGKIRLENDHS